MKKSNLALVLVLGMVLVSSCATVARVASEQEEEIAVPGNVSSGVNSRWESGNWDLDYASE